MWQGNVVYIPPSGMAPQPDQRIRPQMLPQHYQPLIVPMQTLFPPAKHAARRHGANVRQSSQQRYPGWSRERSWSKYTGENGTKTRTQRRWEGHCLSLQQTKNNREQSYGTTSGAFRSLRSMAARPPALLLSAPNQNRHATQARLSASCSRFSKTFPVISRKIWAKVAQKTIKFAFCNESCSKVARKSKNVFFVLIRHLHISHKAPFHE